MGNIAALIPEYKIINVYLTPWYMQNVKQNHWNTKIWRGKGAN